MKRALLLPMVFFALLVIGACGGSSGGGGASAPTSGGGTFSNPFIIDVGTTYSGQVGGFGATWYRFATTQTGFYRGTISNTNGTSDLAFDFFNALGGFEERCDDTFTGNESCTSRDATPPFQLLANFSFLIDVFNFSSTASDYHFLIALD